MPEDLTRRISCPDCGWQFRRLAGAPSAPLSYVERYCAGGCEETKVVVSRPDAPPAVGTLYGRDRIALRDSLRALPDLTAEERQSILRDAMKRAGHHP